MTEWKEYKLGEIASFRTGKLNSNAAVENGKYPFFTCSPITLSIDEYAFDQKAILLAGNNAEGNFCIKYYEGKFNAYQRTYIIESNESKCNLKFLYYSLFLCLQEFKNISQGTSTRFLTAVILNNFKLMLPSLDTQLCIAAILSSLDDKIDLLHRENATLEQMAETLFRQWFVVEAKEEWEEGKLGDLIEVKYGKDHKKLLDGKIPVIGSGGIMRYADTALYNKESVLIPRKGTLNNVMYINEPFWTVDTMFYTEMCRPNIAKFVFHFMKGQDLANMNVGSAVPSMTTEVLNNIPIDIPPQEVFDRFENAVASLYNKKEQNNKQIQTLIQTRDGLLPRLMGGEVKIL